MKLNKIFASHMVFAHGKPIKIYGEGRGKVEISFAKQKKTIVSESDKWMTEFEPMEYGGPYSMEVVFEDNTVVLEDIYIGEVYLFAGQSNLQFKMADSSSGEELYKSNSKLRLFSPERIEKTDFFTPEDGWVVCEKEQVKNWSAIGYLTANEISEQKHIAVGVIVCYQGASVIESWVPEGTFEKAGINIPLDERHKDHRHQIYRQWNADGTLYNFSLCQVIPYPLSAVVWYQGESDTSEGEGEVYADELRALIGIWRKDFDDENLPFAVVQIADFINRNDLAWQLVQNAQMKIQTMLPFVKTVESKDVCETDDIHPPTKDKLSKRIADTLLSRI